MPGHPHELFPVKGNALLSKIWSAQTGESSLLYLWVSLAGGHRFSCCLLIQF